MRRMVILILLVAFLPFGCVRIPRQKNEINRYIIDPPLSKERADTTLDLSVLVQPFLGNATQRADRILYQDDEHGMDFYYYSRWIGPPETMVGDVLVRDLVQWGLFGHGVYQAEAGIVPDYEIQGRLVSLYANNLRGEDSAVFETRLMVLRVDPRTYEKAIFYQQTFPVVVERKNRNIDSFVQAVNDAVGIWLSQVRSELEYVFRQEVARERRNAAPPSVPAVVPPVETAVSAEPAAPAAEIPGLAAPADAVPATPTVEPPPSAPDSVSAVAQPAAPDSADRPRTPAP